MKRKALALTFIMALLFSAAAGAQFVDLARANPFPNYTFSVDAGPSAPDFFTKPPVVSVLTPENGSEYATNAISLYINVSVGESSTATSKYIQEIYYMADWQTKNFSIYKLDENPYTTAQAITQSLVLTHNFTGIPDGNHNLTVFVKERGSYFLYSDSSNLPLCYRYYAHFEINGSSTVFSRLIRLRPSSLSFQCRI